jgi:uncharacterized protein (DUF2252 family)
MRFDRGTMTTTAIPHARPRERTVRAPSAPPATFSERLARGRGARADVPRSSHADWAPAADRPDPVAVMRQEDVTRVPELVPIRYGRMLVSAFTFYRGAAGLMAGDLAATPTSGITVQLCGDAHLSNFGVYAAPDRRLVFDLNDFDETLPGPWEWDIKRLAASLEIAGRDRGFKHRERQAVVAAATRSYREEMRRFAEMGNLEVWYARLDVDDAIGQLAGALGKSNARAAQQMSAKAKSRTSLRAIAKLTERVNGSVRIVSAPPLIVPLHELLPDDDARDVETEVRALLQSYQRSLSPDRRRLVDTYRFVDMARKVVGVGSVGKRAWIILLEGRDAGDPLVLQAKEAEASVLESYLRPSRYRKHGERVVQGQRSVQAASDIFLGWDRVTGFDGEVRDFYVRQLWDGKGSAVVEAMDPAGLSTYGKLCGWTLARAHARSGDRVAIAGYLGSGTAFDTALVAFSEAYADQNERDYNALRAAVAAGRITAETGL